MSTCTSIWQVIVTGAWRNRTGRKYHLIWHEVFPKATYYSDSLRMRSELRFTKAAQILRILSIFFVIEIGTVSFRILKTLRRLIALSTCILTFARRLVLVTSSSESCFPLVNAGIFNFTRSGNNKSWMVKPLSAITSSPGRRLFKMPLSCTINLSLARPP